MYFFLWKSILFYLLHHINSKILLFNFTNATSIFVILLRFPVMFGLGNWCGLGSAYPTQCVPGTYSNSSRNEEVNIHTFIWTHIHTQTQAKRNRRTCKSFRYSFYLPIRHCALPHLPLSYSPSLPLSPSLTLPSPPDLSMPSLSRWILLPGLRHHRPCTLQFHIPLSPRIHEPYLKVPPRVLLSGQDLGGERGVIFSLFSIWCFSSCLLERN
jgi:hypothetical protein